MNRSITRTRVILPRRRSDLLSRERVLTILRQQRDRKLVTVVAPPGYGKTSLLIDFAHQTEHPVCWYSVDTLDDNPTRFFAHLIQSISQQFELFGIESIAALDDYTTSSGNLHQLVTAIVNEIYECIPDRFCLIIDDFHLVADSEEIKQFVNSFVNQMGDNCQLILLSRKFLALPDLPLWVARSEVGGIGLEEMAFQTDEIQALVRQNSGQSLDDGEALELVDRSEGWITGLLFSAQLEGTSLQDQGQVKQATGIDLYDYLAQQVLHQQDQSVQTFLLRTSLLEEFNESFCRQLLAPSIYPEETEWQTLIDATVSHNLFILPTHDDAGSWYRYHNLFREFLQRHIQTRHPEEAQTILDLQIHHYRRQQEWEKAHRACEMLKDQEKLAETVKMASFALVQSMQWSLMNKWLDGLPADVFDSSPYLQAVRAYTIACNGDPTMGLIQLERAIKEQDAFTAEGSVSPSYVITLSWRALTYRMVGKLDEALGDVEGALSLLGVWTPLNKEERTINHVLKAEMLNSKGIIYCLMNRPDEGIGILEESVSCSDTLEDGPRIALLIQDLATANMNAGRYDRARSLFHRALELTNSLHQFSSQAHIQNNLGVLYHRKGDYVRAHESLQSAIDSASRAQNRFLHALCLASLGDIFADLFDIQAATNCYLEVLELATEIDSKYLLLHVELARAQLACMKQEWEQAYEYLDNAGQLVLTLGSQPDWNLYRIAMGQFYLQRKHLERGSSMFREALENALANRQQFEAAIIHLLLGITHFQMGKHQDSYIELMRSAIITKELGSWQAVVVKGSLWKSTLREIVQTTPTPDHSGIEDPFDDPCYKALRFCTELLRRIGEFEQTVDDLQDQLIASGNRQARELGEAGPDLIIRTLGRIEIVYKGRNIRGRHWQAQTARNLFLCLVAHTDGLTKEEIGAMFWAESAPAQLKIRFKNAIYRLRRALFPEVIVFDNDVYRFNRELDYEHDAEEFEKAIVAAQNAESPFEKKQAYSEAIRLYRGEYLTDIDEMWAWLERERLSQLYLDASLRLAELHLDYGEHPEALQLCQGILTIDSCMEEAHRLAMRIHALAGNRSALIRQYEQCESVLRNEFDVAPSEQTQYLYQSLL